MCGWVFVGAQVVRDSRRFQFRGDLDIRGDSPVMKGMYTGWTEGVPEKKSSDKIEKSWR